MNDKLYSAVKDLLSLNNDMGFCFGGDYDDILEHLKEDPINTIESLNKENFLIDTNSLIDGILFSGESETACENFTMQDIREIAGILKEDISRALFVINETVDVSSTIEYINKAFDGVLNYQAYAKCIGMGYWALLDEADEGMDFNVKSNDSYTIGSVKSYLYLADIPDIITFIGYPNCLYEFHAELNPQKYSHTSINVAMFQDKLVVYANAEGYTNNCRDVSKCIAKPAERTAVYVGAPAIRNAKIISDMMINYLEENKSQIKQNVKGNQNKVLE